MGTKYNKVDRVEHKVSNEYTIVFDRVIPEIDGVKQDYEQISMRYVKNGNTVNNAPSFDETHMVKAIVELYKSDIISSESKDLLRNSIK